MIKRQTGRIAALEQRVHCYIPVDGQESKPIKYRDRVNPRVDMHQEGVETPSGVSFPRKGTPVLLDESEPGLHILDEIVWESAGTGFNVVMLSRLVKVL